MLMEVKKSLRLIVYYIKFNISSAMEYRASFLIQCFGMMLNNSAFIFFWWILFNNVKSIGGYGFKEEMLLWAIMSTSFGFCHIIFGNIGQITRMILNGELDTYLLQPKDPLVNILCSRTILSAWGDALYGIVLIIALNGLDGKRLIMFFVFAITGAMIMAAVLVTFHALSFYSGNTEGMAQLVMEFIISFSIYPEGIFSNGLRFVFYTIIPVAFTVYVPARAIMSSSVTLLTMVIGVVIIWIVVAYIVFYRGLKRYESGNLIISKL